MKFLGIVAQRYQSYFRGSDNRFGCMPAIKKSLGVLRVEEAKVRLVGRRKRFSEVQQLSALAENGGLVQVDVRGTDISAALVCSNHRSAASHSDSVIAGIFDDARFGRALMFRRSEAHTPPDLRLSPLGVAVSPPNTRIIQDLAFSVFPRIDSVNTDTDFEHAVRVALGRVLRYAIWHITCVHRRFGPRTRRGLCNTEVTEASRQVSVQWDGVPGFGYDFTSGS